MYCIAVGALAEAGYSYSDLVNIMIKTGRPGPWPDVHITWQHWTNEQSCTACE